MVLILRLCQKSKYMGDICMDGGVTEEEIESSASSMIEWLEDVKQADGIANWSMRVLWPLLYIASRALN